MQLHHSAIRVGTGAPPGAADPERPFSVGPDHLRQGSAHRRGRAVRLGDRHDGYLARPICTV